jgi:hypothetical protein
MLALFAAAAFVAAALLFVVQPLAGKPLLTLVGGAPSVWTGAMLFFQAALLAGYVLAHLLTRGRSLARRWIAVAVLVAGASAAVFARAPQEPPAPDAAPTLWVLLTLGAWVGVPFVAMATLSPLLQRWFSLTRHPRAADPYFLSVASNLGSACGLLAYPFLVEPSLDQHMQWKCWGLGMAGVVVLVAACAACARPRSNDASESRAPSEIVRATPHADVARVATPPTLRDLARWCLLAFIPSSLMLGLTQHITTDIAPVPLLWVLPLLLYLLTFALAFAPEPPASSQAARVRWWHDQHFWSRALAIPLLSLTLAMLLHARTPVQLVLGLHLLVFVVGAMLCHRRLAILRPAPAHLTWFYFAIAIGGVLGGIANALLAPLLFDRILEYPIALAALAVARPSIAQGRSAIGGFTGPGASMPPVPPAGGFARVARLVALAAVPAGVAIALGLLAARLTLPRPVESLLAAGVPTLLLGLMFLWEARLGDVSRRRNAPGPSVQRRSPPRWFIPLALAGTLVAGEFTQSQRATLHQERTFFGVHRVEITADQRFHVLLHGTTAHGIQGAPTHPDFERLRAVPGAYYHPDGPAGSLVRAVQSRGTGTRVGLVGLGTGAIASFARAGDQFAFFEIDPSVVRVADSPAFFTYLSDARARGATLRTVVGDGRQTLAREPEASFDLIIIDAFSSDAIPTHLLTREAIALYLSRLAPGGVLALHISNRAFNLAPVLCRHAQDLGLASLDNNDVVVTSAQLEDGKSESWWFALARDQESLAGLRANNRFWKRPDDLARSDLPLWTDQRSDVLDVLIW